MNVIINGESLEFDQPPSVSQVLERFELTGSPCAVEVNRAIVPHRRHAEHVLCDGDQVEIVTLVGGG